MRQTLEGLTQETSGRRGGTCGVLTKDGADRPAQELGALGRWRLYVCIPYGDKDGRESSQQKRPQPNCSFLKIAFQLYFMGVLL